MADIQRVQIGSIILAAQPYVDSREPQDSVISRSVNDPLSLTPSDGDRYIVPVGALSDWSGHDDDIAVYSTALGNWKYLTPSEGFRTWVDDEDQVYVYYSSSWQAYGGGTPGPAETLQQTYNASASPAVIDLASSKDFRVTTPAASSADFEVRGGTSGQMAVRGSSVGDLTLDVDVRSINLETENQTTGNVGSITISTGVAIDDVSDGGDININTSTNLGSTGATGSISVLTGNSVTSGSEDGDSGSIELTTGRSTNGTAGSIDISTGYSTNGTAGSILLSTGSADDGVKAGDIIATAGDSDNSVAGVIGLSAGDTQTGTGGAVSINGGGSDSSAAGDVSVVAGTTDSGTAGDALLYGGDATSGTAGHALVVGGSSDGVAPAGSATLSGGDILGLISPGSVVCSPAISGGSGGSVNITGGASYVPGTAGGDITIEAGLGDEGGSVSITSGDASSGDAGDITLELGQGSVNGSLVVQDSTSWFWRSYRTAGIGPLTFMRSSLHFDRGSPDYRFKLPATDDANGETGNLRFDGGDRRVQVYSSSWQNVGMFYPGQIHGFRMKWVSADVITVGPGVLRSPTDDHSYHQTAILSLDMTSVGLGGRMSSPRVMGIYHVVLMVPSDPNNPLELLAVRDGETPSATGYTSGRAIYLGSIADVAVNEAGTGVAEFINIGGGGSSRKVAYSVGMVDVSANWFGRVLAAGGSMSMVPINMALYVPKQASAVRLYARANFDYAGKGGCTIGSPIIANWNGYFVHFTHPLAGANPYATYETAIWPFDRSDVTEFRSDLAGDPSNDLSYSWTLISVLGADPPAPQLSLYVREFEYEVGPWYTAVRR